MYNRDKIIQTMRNIHAEAKTIAPYVVVAQPRRVREETPAQNFTGDPLHVHFIGHSHGFVDVYGEKVDVARNYLMEAALESGAKYMLFVGEDTVLPYDAFADLHKTAKEHPDAIVTGVYYVKLSDPMIMVRENNWITVPNVDPGQVIDAWMTGMDCMLIPIEILRRLKEDDPELPFCCIGHKIEDIPFVGEDAFFLHRVRRLGIKLLVNTDCQCLHMDLATGKYTAHPSVNLKNYLTNIPITSPLVRDDKEYIDRRWVDRVPTGTGQQE